jgi:hypothetical protein
MSGAAFVLSLLATAGAVLQLGPDIAGWRSSPTCAKPDGLRPIVKVAGVEESAVPAVRLKSQVLSGQAGGAALAGSAARNVLDEKGSTAWLMPGGDGGRGEWIAFALGGLYDLQLVCVLNGHAQSQVTYAQFGRVHDVRVDTRKGSVSGALEDLGPTEYQRKYQQLPIRRGRTNFVRIRIMTFYAGSGYGDRDAYPDTALAEIHFYVR